MRLEGSCHCGLVRFSLDSSEPVPYQRCYCSICRKAGGAGGYAINLGGDAATLQVEGREHVRVYRAMRETDGVTAPSRHARHFCGTCGSHLWAAHDDWPALVHPVAGAIDTPLPPAPSSVHLMLGSKAGWVRVEGDATDPRFDGYPALSLAEWHREHARTVAI